VKGPDGRWLVADAGDGHTPRLQNGPAQPGDRETFEIVTVAAGRSALRARSSGKLLAFDPTAKPPGTVEIYRIRELPVILQTALPAAICALAAAELSGKEYDKTRERKIEKYVDLPDPTLKNLKRMKRHQVLGLTEQSRVQAKLDGPPELRIPAMPLLVGCGDGGSCLMLLSIEASLPVQGRVQYKVPDAASASTGYRTLVRFAAVAEVPLERRGSEVAVGSPAVIDLSVSLAHLKLSNDLLDAVRRQIEGFINHELRHNEDRMRQQANQAIQKALSAHEVRIPLVGYLGLL
jgi:hypothetical protein